MNNVTRGYVAEATALKGNKPALEALLKTAEDDYGISDRYYYALRNHIINMMYA